MAASLHRRLVVILVGLVVTTWTISVLVTAYFAEKTVINQIDRQLTHYMDMAQHSMVTISRDPQIRSYFWRSAEFISREPDLARLSSFGSQGTEQATNLWYSRRQVLVGEQAPRFPDPKQEGIVNWVQTANGEEAEWRILYRRDENSGIWLATGINMAYAPNLGAITVLRVILPLLVILPLTVAILLWGIGRGLRPLDELAKKISDRRPLALEPIDAGGVPREILPVLTSLNNLLERLQRALASENRFTANAAHELQTPLAAIKAEVQRCQRHVADDASREMLERISARVTRAADTVTQLLTLARLDPEQEFQRQDVDLNELLMDVLAEEGGLAMDRELDLRVSENGPAMVCGHPEWLKIMMRNLLANAFRYSPFGGTVDIDLEKAGGTLLLRIVNDCNPIPHDELARLTDRFYSPPGNKNGGVGLGLSIVQRIADLHGAHLSLESLTERKGFAAKVEFNGS